MNNENLLFQILLMNERATRAEFALETIKALIESDVYINTDKVKVIVDTALKGKEVDADAE